MYIFLIKSINRKNFYLQIVTHTDQLLHIYLYEKIETHSIIFFDQYWINVHFMKPNNTSFQSLDLFSAIPYEWLSDSCSAKANVCMQIDTLKMLIKGLHHEGDILKKSITLALSRFKATSKESIDISHIDIKPFVNLSLPGITVITKVSTTHNKNATILIAKISNEIATTIYDHCKPYDHEITLQLAMSQ